MTVMMPIHRTSPSDMDWSIVAVARDDGPRSLNTDRLMARFLNEFLGIPVYRRLADDGLEALRRFSIRAWYWDCIRPCDVRPMIDAGYSHDDVLRILEHVGQHRGFTPLLVEGAA